AERVAAPLVLRDGDAEEQEEEVSIVVVEEDRYAPGPACADVEDPPVGHRGARLPSHASDGSPPAPLFPHCGAIATLPPHQHSAETAMAGAVSDMASRDVAVGAGPVRQYSFDVIRARGLEKRYGERRVLRGVEFELARGGLLLVTGPNGSGKTTLLRMCAGLATPTAGELAV